MAGRVLTAHGRALDPCKPRRLPHGLRGAVAGSGSQGGAAEAEATRRVQLQQALHKLQQLRRHRLDQGQSIGLPTLPTLEELSHTVLADVFEELALASLRGLPRVVACGHGEQRHAKGEGIHLEGTVGRRLLVHLRRPVGNLAADLTDAPARHRGHAKVDDAHAPAAIARGREKDVLKREVPVRDAVPVKAPHGREGLGNHRLQDALPLGPWAVLVGAPREEVAVSRKARHDVRVVVVSEDARKLAHVGAIHLVQVLQQRQVKPRLLRGLRVPHVERSRPAANPMVRHPLDRDHGSSVLRSHHVNVAEVAFGILQLLNVGEGAVPPGLHAARDLVEEALHGLPGQRRVEDARAEAARRAPEAAAARAQSGAAAAAGASV
mmetsp:Transcript_33027/g.87288  ORF Transcript_33027/g.87288 Transcript_33027/m.87288 type:complete len:379 (-) Transcript_33027:206-1342(-)